MRSAIVVLFAVLALASASRHRNTDVSSDASSDSDSDRDSDSFNAITAAVWLGKATADCSGAPDVPANTPDTTMPLNVCLVDNIDGGSDFFTCNEQGVWTELYYPNSADCTGTYQTFTGQSGSTCLWYDSSSAVTGGPYTWIASCIRLPSPSPSPAPSPNRRRHGGRGHHMRRA